MIRAFDLDIEINLKPLSKFLWHKGIKHRISEESGKQVVWVADEQQAVHVRQFLESWRSGTSEPPWATATANTESARSTGHRSREGIENSVIRFVSKIVSEFWVAPVTLCLIVICCLVALITGFGDEPNRLAFLFYPALPFDSLFSLLAGMNSLQLLLRSLAPMFLHFGELHIVFNLLWLWYFGRQLETLQTSWHFLLLVVITSFAANTTQYLASQASNFGGMSGVVYGLVGYAWILHNFVPGKKMLLNNSILVVFIIALVLMELIASSWIATAAHVGGLLAGLLAGVFVVLLDRFNRTSST